MPDQKNRTDYPPSTEAGPIQNQTTRRGFLAKAGITSIAGGILVSKDIFSSAAAEEDAINQTVSEHARKEVLPVEAFGFPRYTPKKTGDFDLSDPLDNHIAWAKVQANLAGDYSWMYQYGWIVVAPPNEPAYPFLGRVTMVKSFLTPAIKEYVPDAEEHDYMLWGMFTTTHVDPRTFEPVDRILNPYTGKLIDVPTIQYADKLVYRFGKSILVPGIDPTFYTQPWDAAGGFSQHNIDAGHKVSYTVLGSSQQPGPNQPRCDVGFWTADRKELMDSKNKSIDVQRDYSVIQKMTEYGWYGAKPGDQAQLLVHLTGGKVHDTKKLPSFVKSLILDKFSSRYA